jgi:hypothetical protein
MVTMLAMRAHDTGPRQGQRARRRLCPGSPHRLHRLAHHGDAHVRPEEHRRQSRRRSLCIGGGEALAVAIELL